VATKRTPIQRKSRERITPRAVQAFGEMKAARAKCTCEPADWEGEYWKHKECRACEEWWDHHFVLWQEVGADLWQWPCIRDPDAGIPYPRGSWAFKHWQQKLGERSDALALYRALEQEAS
jgi:hypothetical protein